VHCSHVDAARTQLASSSPTITPDEFPPLRADLDDDRYNRLLKGRAVPLIRDGWLEKGSRESRGTTRRQGRQSCHTPLVTYTFWARFPLLPDFPHSSSPILNTLYLIQSLSTHSSPLHPHPIAPPRKNTMADRVDQHPPQSPNKKLLATIRTSELGYQQQTPTPYGPRSTVYCDYTASARPLSFLEHYISSNILNVYGNTHTSTSSTGRQTSDFLGEARGIIRDCLRCNKDDRVIFIGSGATAGVQVLVRALGLEIGGDGTKPEGRRLDEIPLVIIGPYEHHSNMLPWRESLAEVITVRLTPNGELDIDHLIIILKQAVSDNRPLVVGSFSAASNVSGQTTDVSRVTSLLKEHNALSFWDYAAAAPHASQFEMNPRDPLNPGREGKLRKDALFFSPHKLA
jgi:hypothetical protein